MSNLFYCFNLFLDILGILGILGILDNLYFFPTNIFYFFSNNFFNFFASLYIFISLFILFILTLEIYSLFRALGAWSSSLDVATRFTGVGELCLASIPRLGN